MDTFSIIRESLADAIPISKERTKTLAQNQFYGPKRDVAERAGPVMAAVQMVVDVLTPADGGGKFSASFADISTAATNLDDRTIVVSVKPLTSPLLDNEQAAVAIATLAAHEIGHNYVTGPRRRSGVLDAKSDMAPIMGHVTNVADDVLLERFMEDRFPILAGCFRFTGDWIMAEGLREAGEANRHPVLTSKSRLSERFNVALLALRYPIDSPMIVWDDANAIALRDRVIDWDVNVLTPVPLKDHAGFVAACEALVALLGEDIDDLGGEGGDEPPDQPEGPEGPEGPTTTCTLPGPGGDDEGGDEPPPVNEGPTQPGGDEEGPDGEGGEDEGEGPTKPTDETGDDDGEGDGEGGDDATDGDDDDGDNDGPDGGIKVGNDGDDIDGDGDDDGDGEGHGESDTDDTGDVKKASDEFDGGDIDSTLDDLTSDAEVSEIAQRAAINYAGTGKVAFQGHGTAEVHWD